MNNYSVIRSILNRINIFSKLSVSGRSRAILLNVSSSAILKIISMLISFMMVPITLTYLDKTRYGLWAALSSFLAWYFLFDLGVGSGLRNKFTELKAKGQFDEIKYYVSTAYFIFTCLAVFVSIAFYVSNLFINWPKLLKAPDNLAEELSNTALFVFIILSASFSIKLITNILFADLKNALSEAISVIAHLFSFFGIIILNKYAVPSLLYYALLYTGVNFTTTLIASIILYSTIYKQYAPRISAIRLSLARGLFSTGIKFFFVGIVGLILYRSTPFIISNLLGPLSVTDYSINQNYFSMAYMLMAFFTQPLWSGYGDAYHRNDIGWIKRTFKRMRIIWIVVILLMLVMLAGQKLFFHFWLKDRIGVDYVLSILFIIYYIIFSWGGIYNLLLNATSKLRLQLYLSSIITPIYILLAVGFVKFTHLGVKGVILALIIATFPSAIVYPIQCMKILNHKGGIWER